MSIARSIVAAQSAVGRLAATAAQIGARPLHSSGLAAAHDLPDVVIYGMNDWHFRMQRPQHLANELNALGSRIFYISPLLYDSPYPGFTYEIIKDSPPLFQISLFADGAPLIHGTLPDISLLCQLDDSIRDFFLWAKCEFSIALVQHPFWTETALSSNHRAVIYDCFDLISAFAGAPSKFGCLEEKLIRSANAVTVTGSSLAVHAREMGAKNIYYVRNACDFQHFSQSYNKFFLRTAHKPVVGYFGAILDWFDTDLLRQTVSLRPYYNFLIIGNDLVNAKYILREYENVTFLGEVAYEDLPAQLSKFDIGIIPFRINALTCATDPVKIYEYFAAGIPVVATKLPELDRFGSLVLTAADPEEFVNSLDLGLAESDENCKKRIDLARTETWRQRAITLLAVFASYKNIRSSHP